jgi:hypothetical protein
VTIVYKGTDTFPLEKEDPFEVGWLTGLIDGEGFIHVHYRKNRDTTHPRLRIYCTTKEIITEACRIMGVNPYPRRDHGKLLGWYAQVSERRAIMVLRIIAPHLTEPSKRCRAMRILQIFGESGSISGRHPSAEFFEGCPPPTRLRKPPEAYKSSLTATHRSEVGKPDPPWG